MDINENIFDSQVYKVGSALRGWNNTVVITVGISSLITRSFVGMSKRKKTKLNSLFNASFRDIQ